MISLLKSRLFIYGALFLVTSYAAFYGYAKIQSLRISILETEKDGLENTVSSLQTLMSERKRLYEEGQSAIRRLRQQVFILEEKRFQQDLELKKLVDENLEVKKYLEIRVPTELANFYCRSAECLSTEESEPDSAGSQ